MSNCYILSGGRIIDPIQNIDGISDIGVKDGKIISADSIKNKAEVIDMTGKIIAPGFIDIHVHLREPGGEYKETIETAANAAIAGGFTKIISMPNTKPAADNAETIKYILDKAEKMPVKIYPSGAFTESISGHKFTNVEELKNAGIIALTDDGLCLQKNRDMFNVVKEAKKYNLPVMDHCEDSSLAHGGSINEGIISKKLDLKGIPNVSEDIIVARNIVIAEALDWKIHMQHLSSKRSVEYVREARKKGLKITAEVCPHHIALTENSIKSKTDSNFKMNPPLRTEEDRLEILKGLKDNSITIIATDHAPHSEEEKTGEIQNVPFGILGLETAIPVCLTELYHKNILSINELIAKFTKGPADLLEMDIALTENNSADFTILDLDSEHIIDKNNFKSKSKNTPFDKYQAKGKICATIVDGKINLA